MPGPSNRSRISNNSKEEPRSNAACALCDLIYSWKFSEQADVHYADGEGIGLIPAYVPPKHEEISHTPTAPSNLTPVSAADSASLDVATPKTPLLRVEPNKQDSVILSTPLSVGATPGSTLPGHIPITQKSTTKSQLGSKLNRPLTAVSSNPALIPITEADPSLKSHTSIHDITSEMCWPGSPSYVLPDAADGGFGGKRGKGGKAKSALHRWVSKSGKAVRDILRRN